MGWMKDETGLDKRAANFVPLTPLSHLNRAATVFPDHTALVYGSFRKTYSQYHARVSQLASALAAKGIKPGDVVATLMPNIPAQAEALFAVPACGAILNTINMRLETETIAYILDHGEAAAVLVDSAFVGTLEAAINAMQGPAPLIIEVPDCEANHSATGRHLTYEELLETGDPKAPWIWPEDEWESIALNYTSGTTGKPKGVVYHHRGAYLITLGTPIAWRIATPPRLLAIVPFFHCNNWCHTWMLPALGGTLICCRDVSAKAIYDAIADEGVTHFGGAPIVLNMIVNSDAVDHRPFDHTVQIMTAGAPPAPATLAAIEPMGFNVTQVYGLTETFGHCTFSEWRGEDWDALPETERAALKARQGIPLPNMEPIAVTDSAMQAVPMDGESAGEIMIRGNVVMKGYYKNPEATAEVFEGGYFHSGDIAVQHPDSFVQVTDRAKDIIISGGENISSVEVESALMHHPAVSLCAVVAKPDEKWGEVPCAFIELKAGASATEPEVIAFTKSRLAGFKTPKRVIFDDLPKTATGKIQKFELRTRAAKL